MTVRSLKLDRYRESTPMKDPRLKWEQPNREKLYESKKEQPAETVAGHARKQHRREGEERPTYYAIFVPIALSDLCY